MNSLELILYLFLALTLYFLYHGLVVGDYPEIKTLKDISLKLGLPFISVLITFTIATPILMSPVAGAIIAILGWELPKRIQEELKFRRLKRNRELAENFVTSAGGLFGAGMVTSQVFKYFSNRFPEPFKSEFKVMVNRKNLDPTISYPEMLNELAEKYELQEVRAMSNIISAAEKAGGTTSTAKGLKRLGRAIRLRNELVQERQRQTYEPKVASRITMFLVGGGILLDVTWFRSYFEEGGLMAQLCIIFSCLMFVFIAVMGRRATKIDDIQ